MEHVPSITGRHLPRRLVLVDWLYIFVLTAGAAFSLTQFGAYMDYYEKAILVLSVPATVWLGIHWKPAQWALTLISAMSLLAIWLYAGNLDRGSSIFLLKYMFASQSAITWMCTLFSFRRCPSGSGFY